MDWVAPLTEIEVTDGDVEAVLDCLRSGWLTMGPRTQALEAQLAERIGVNHAIAVSSGTAALHLACRAAGVGPGDEVIVPSLCFVAAAHAPRYLGADPVLADSLPGQAGIDPVAVEALVSDRTKAVIAVHMWGYPAAVEELRALCEERRLVLIEDACEAIDARTNSGESAGAVGALGCFSFFSKKQLAVGEGGLVTTDDDALAAQVRSLRSHAMSSVTWERHRGHGLGYDVTDVGYNYRLDEPRAALALSRLERLTDEVERRREGVRLYRRALAGVEDVVVPYTDKEVELGSHFAFPVLLPGGEERDAVRERLKERGVQTTAYPALHMLSQYAADPAELPHATEVSRRHLALPLHPLIDEATVELVVDRLAGAVAAA